MNCSEIQQIFNRIFLKFFFLATEHLGIAYFIRNILCMKTIYLLKLKKIIN